MNKFALSFYLSSKKTILTLIDKILSTIGVQSHGLTVLCYHSFSNSKYTYSISPKYFESQLKAIISESEIVPITQAAKILKDGRTEKSQVVITIDDGYKSVLKIVPIVEKYNIPVTLFILAAPKNVNRKELETGEELLTLGDIRTLVSKGWTIGSHGLTHSNFNKLTSEEIEKEIAGSKKILEKQLGVKIKYFAYPKGTCSEESLKFVEQAGYEAAFTVYPDNLTNNSNRWILPRIIIDKSHEVDEFPLLYSKSALFIRRRIDKLEIRRRFVSI